MTNINRLLKIAATDSHRTKEHFVHHPEKRTIRHIALVTLRSLIWGDANLQMAALFHDIAKPLRGRIHKDGHWTNRFHAPDGAKIALAEKAFIKAHGAQVSAVGFICRRHMDFKFGWKKCPPGWRSTMEEFEKLDNVTNSDGSLVGPREARRIEFSTPDGTELRDCSFVGIAPIHRESGEVVTITLDRTPVHFTWSDLPHIVINGNDLMKIFSPFLA